MAIIRVEKQKNYTVMSNHHLQDGNLSLKAKGLLSMMLSLPEDWVYSVEGLVSLCKEGRDAVRSALTELEDTGYDHQGKTDYPLKSKAEVAADIVDRLVKDLNSK